MSFIIGVESWFKPNAQTDLITLGQDRFWFSQGKIIAYEIENKYHVRGFWISGYHWLQLPNRNAPGVCLSTGSFINALRYRFRNFYAEVRNALFEPMWTERYAGERAKAIKLIIGDVAIWFSFGVVIAYKVGGQSIVVSENPGKGPTTRHFNCFVPFDHPRIPRAEFLARMEREIPTARLRSLMLWID